MSDPRDVILRPVVSEKSYALLDQGVYTFVVHPDANKIEIRQAVESIFSVQVVKVNTLEPQGQAQAQPPPADVRQAARHQAGHRDPGRGTAHRPVRELRT